MRRLHRIGVLVLLLFLPICLAAEGTGEVLVPDTEDRAIALQVEEQLVWDDRIDADELIAQEIREALERNEYVNADRITVAVSEGNVLLTGTVESLRAKRAADRTALLTGGVTEIENEIEVDPPDPEVPEEDLADRVRSQLAWDTRVDADEILVEVEGATVVLAGRVETAAERQVAGESVETIPAVREVINRIEVARTPELTLDATLERTIRNVLQLNPAIDAADVDIAVERIAGNVVAALMRDDRVDAGEVAVIVENGVVTLRGTLSSRSAARAAYATASLTAGVREVIDRMEIR